MFHLQILYLMLELAIDIFLLDKGDSWIYLTCCGALIDFFLCELLCLIPYPLIEVCFFEGSVRFCMINYEICNKIYRLTSHLTQDLFWNLHRAMVSKNHKINHKSQGNNSVKSFIVLSVYSLFSYLLTFLINNSGDGNCFYRAVAPRGDETGDETRRSVGGVTVFFFSEKFKGYFSCHSSLQLQKQSRFLQH